MNESTSTKKFTMLGDVLLRAVEESDLPFFYKMQLDADATYMAAFAAKDPSDMDAFTRHWNKILDDDTVLRRTILFTGQVVGNIASFERAGEREVCYWIEKEYWSRGIASMALKLFLSEVKLRPLFARAAKDNIASVRVLEKCGFKICGQDKGFANARGEEIEEVILTLK
jgi:RimJ/RimL family protein N-acetyltransferase